MSAPNGGYLCATAEPIAIHALRAPRISRTNLVISYGDGRGCVTMIVTKTG